MRAVQLAQKLWELPWMRNQSVPQSSQYLSSTRIGMSPFEGRAQNKKPCIGPRFQTNSGRSRCRARLGCDDLLGIFSCGHGPEGPRGYVVSVAPTGLGYFFASDPTARAVGARFA